MPGSSRWVPSGFAALGLFTGGTFAEIVLRQPDGSYSPVSARDLLESNVILTAGSNGWLVTLSGAPTEALSQAATVPVDWLGSSVLAWGALGSAALLVPVHLNRPPCA